ncbi:hypothetical protein JI721_10250 [Alicyclobacillus cycloheptanicus]|uniref:Lipoprotein n=1 Tax=Alicyclobacillus cycloheptanicus TaxID=1457 RepID=A0ABT9XMW4_9BACL|nr:hypothetical protein [Alicyclobacillus cycloheptanicus]MDQ0191663.1 hypothetical protein [Alicyclobacillus cycloheptanicus]WDM00132.1 hypothetical protein JI721_10250 [Alicyclobacillus cycloheptanicus]
MNRTSLLLATLVSIALVVGGCSNSQRVASGQNTPPPTTLTSKKVVDVVSATSRAVSKQYDANPEQVVRHGMSWKLSNGASVTAEHAKIKYKFLLGDNGGYVVQVSETTNPYYYIVYVARDNGEWLVSGVVAAPVFTPKVRSGLPGAFSKLIGSKMTVPNGGTFYAFYDQNTFLMMGHVHDTDEAHLPSGKPVKLASGQDAVMVSGGSSVELYYFMGDKLVPESVTA